MELWIIILRCLIVIISVALTSLCSQIIRIHKERKRRTFFDDRNHNQEVNRLMHLL